MAVSWFVFDLPLIPVHKSPWTSGSSCRDFPGHRCEAVYMYTLATPSLGSYQMSRLLDPISQERTDLSTLMTVLKCSSSSWARRVLSIPRGNAFPFFYCLPPKHFLYFVVSDVSRSPSLLGPRVLSAIEW